jgi:hypothetical protein
MSPLMSPLRFVVYVACTRHPSFSRAFDEKEDGGGDLRLAMMMTPQVMTVLVAVAMITVFVATIVMLKTFTCSQSPQFACCSIVRQHQPPPADNAA